MQIFKEFNRDVTVFRILNSYVPNGTPEEVAVYLEAVLKEDDPALLLVALRNVAVSQGGIAMMAANSGLRRCSLYRT